MLTLKDFEETGALLTGHFKLSSGLHSDRYLQCARLLMWPARAEAAGKALAERLSTFAPAAVVGPALGAIVIGHEVARSLGIPFLFAERQDGVFAFRRGFGFGARRRAVVVEDVFTTGRSTREVIEAARGEGAEVLAAGAIVDRGLPQGALPVPTVSLLSVAVPAWPEADCPLCRAGVPLETPGSRHVPG